MRLNIYVEGDNNLVNKYLEVSRKHNDKIMKEPFFFDAGFDLYLSDVTEFTRDNGVNKVNFQLVKTIITTTTININKSPRISINPEENTSAIASISETSLVTKDPIGVSSKYFILKDCIWLNNL